MYLTEPKLSDIVKKQYRFKLNAHAAAFTTLIIIQMVTIFLTVWENGSSHFHGSFSSIKWMTFSNESTFLFTILWAFILGIMLTSATRRNEPFSFVTNRLSNQFANFLFMLTAALIGGFTAALTGPALKLFVFLLYDEVNVVTPGLLAAPGDFFIRIITAIAYVLLFFLIGYTISSLVQFNKLFIVILLVGWFASFNGLGGWNSARYFSSIVEFFGAEQSMFVFLIKICGTVLLLFTVSAASTNRMEVR